MKKREQKINPQVQKVLKRFFLLLDMQFYTFLVVMIMVGILSLGFEEALAPEFESNIIWFVPISVIAFYLLNIYLFKSRLDKAKKAEKLFEKMEIYRAAIVFRFLIFDFMAAAGFLGYLMTKLSFSYAVGLAIMAIYILLKPTKKRFMDDCDLSVLERQVVKDHTVK